MSNNYAPELARPAAAAAPSAAASPARRVGGRPALLLLASLVVSLLAASAAPTPLYATYAQEWGFTPSPRRSSSACTRSRCSPRC